jgi:DNA-directed RNA polymerase specialized sigma24 family protein
VLLIEDIAECEKYKNFCKKITGYDEVLWKDLHQEFLIAVMNNSKLKTIPENEVDLYLYGIAHRLWNDPKRGRNTYKLEKSPFYSLKDNPQNLQDYFEEREVRKLSKAEIELRKLLVEELNRLLESDNERVKKGAEFLRLYIEGKNRLQISQELGVNYRIVHDSISETVNRIRSRVTNKTYMTKTEIQITLRGEGVKASYSGKDKTFYVDKVPASGIVKEIEQAGFKVEKSK